MGNTQCGRCLTRESEMIAEILLGKNEEKQINIQNPNESIRAIKEIMPMDKASKRLDNDKSNNVNNLNEQNSLKQSYRGKKDFESNQNIYNSNILYNKENNKKKLYQKINQRI